MSLKLIDLFLNGKVKESNPLQPKEQTPDGPTYSPPTFISFDDFEEEKSQAYTEGTEEPLEANSPSAKGPAYNPPSSISFDDFEEAEEAKRPTYTEGTEEPLEPNKPSSRTPSSPETAPKNHIGENDEDIDR